MISEALKFRSYSGVTKQGAKSNTPVNGIDWYPTLLDLCGIEISKKQNIDGVSLVPLLKGKTIQNRPLYWHYPHYGNQGGEPSSIIMEGDWKLIYYHEDGRDELYHLGNDIGEQNVDCQRKNGQTNAEKFDTWLKQTNAKFPKPDPKFDSAKKKPAGKTLNSGNKDSKNNMHLPRSNYKPNNDYGEARLLRQR